MSAFRSWVKCGWCPTVTLNQLKPGDVFRRVDNLDISEAWLTVVERSNRGNLKVIQTRPLEWATPFTLQQRHGLRYVKIEDDPRIPYKEQK